MSKVKHTHTTSQKSKRKPSSGSWVVERDALKEFGDRKARAILAIFTARRSSGKKEFFVPPHIAELYHLTPRDLNWAFKKLEGQITDTSGSRKGKFRHVRLTPEWEDRETGGGDMANRQASSDGSDEELVVIDKDVVTRGATMLPVDIDRDVAATLREISEGNADF